MMKKKNHMQETRATKLTCNQCVAIFKRNVNMLVEQRFAIKFYMRLKKNTAETILLLQEAFGNEVLG